MPEDSALPSLLANVLDTVVDANEHAVQVCGPQRARARGRVGGGAAAAGLQRAAARRARRGPRRAGRAPAARTRRRRRRRRRARDARGGGGGTAAAAAAAGGDVRAPASRSCRCGGGVHAPRRRRRAAAAPAAGQRGAAGARRPQPRPPAPAAPPPPPPSPRPAHLTPPRPAPPRPPAQDADPALVPALTVFHGLRAPPISVEAYLVRVAKYAKCSPACFVQALALVFRLARRDAAYQLTSLNVHRLLLTGVLLSAKFLDDHYYNNAFYAKVGGVTTAELNRLEVEMLGLLAFRLLVPREELEQLLADARAGCLAGQVVARWRCGGGGGAGGAGGGGARKRRSVGLDAAGGGGEGGACDAGSRRGSVEVAAPRRLGRVMA